MASAASELLALEPDGLQLTPGNAPTIGFVEDLADRSVPVRTHQGFSTTALATRVWSGCDLLNRSDSVHAPRASHAVSEESGHEFLAAHAAGRYGNDVVFETMYPGYCLGSGPEIDRAMTQRMRLAVDVSHVFMQMEQGVMSAATWSRLRDYDMVEEVHISANDGRRDAHQPIDRSSFGLGWAAERASAGTPVVLESYLHALHPPARREVVDCFREMVNL